MTPETVSLRRLNRWTLARQMLLEREHLDAVAAIERLAGMQAQYSPSPYIGLWSRLHGFQRDELESALQNDSVLKATLMRFTLHLVSARDFDAYRVAVRKSHGPHAVRVERLQAKGIQIDRVREAIIEAVRERPMTRSELRSVIFASLPEETSIWDVWTTSALYGDLINHPDDGLFGYFGGTRYRLAPPREAERDEAIGHVVRSYLAAFGPATRADLAQWSGGTVATFAPTLESLETVQFRGEDGRTLFDLPDAPRPDEDVPAPVRFLPKWDNILLAYARRERVLPEEHRKTVIRKNGDVLPTFLVDGVVAGTWDVPLRGRAVMTLTPLDPIETRHRPEIEHEGEALLVWLRPDTDRREVRWTSQ